MLLRTPGERAAAREQKVHVLQIPVRRLDVEEVDRYQHGEVQQCKEHKDVKVDGGNEVRHDLVDQAAGQGEGNGGEGGAFRACGEWEDLLHCEDGTITVIERVVERLTSVGYTQHVVSHVLP